VTTVAFVTYKASGIDRRVGPLPKEQAESMAKELSRQTLVQDVCLEEWVCLKVTSVGKPA